MNGGLQCYVTAFWLSPFPTIMKRRPLQPSLNISSFRHKFHHLIFNSTIISIVSSSLRSSQCMHLSLQFPFPNSIMGATPAVICTSLCISITINDGAHCQHHIFQFHICHHLWQFCPIIPIAAAHWMLKLAF